MQELPSGWSRRRFLTLTGMAGLSLAACAARVPAHGGQTQATTGSALENAARDHPVALINRLTWGATEGDLNSLRQRGVGHYVNAQLRPPADPVLPPEVVAQLQAMTINRTPVADLARSSFEQLRSIRKSDLPADQKQQHVKQRAIVSRLGVETASNSFHS